MFINMLTKLCTWCNILAVRLVCFSSWSLFEEREGKGHDLPKMVFIN